MMREDDFTIADLKEILPWICLRETSADPAGWSKRCAVHGHCAVVAILVQRLYGGEIMRGSLEHVPQFAHMRSHYWNRLPLIEGEPAEDVDLTRAQFGDAYPSFPAVETRTPEQLLAHPDTLKRFERVWGMFASLVLRD